MQAQPPAGEGQAQAPPLAVLHARPGVHAGPGVGQGGGGVGGEGRGEGEEQGVARPEAVLQPLLRADNLAGAGCVTLLGGVRGPRVECVLPCKGTHVQGDTVGWVPRCKRGRRRHGPKCRLRAHDLRFAVCAATLVPLHRVWATWRKRAVLWTSA